MFEENHQLHDRILVLNQQMADEFGMGAKQQIFNEPAKLTPEPKKESPAIEQSLPVTQTTISATDDEALLREQMNQSNMFAEALQEKDQENAKIVLECKDLKAKMKEY